MLCSDLLFAGFPPVPRPGPTRALLFAGCVVVEKWCGGLWLVRKRVERVAAAPRDGVFLKHRVLPGLLETVVAVLCYAVQPADEALHAR